MAFYLWLETYKRQHMGPRSTLCSPLGLSFRAKESFARRSTIFSALVAVSVQPKALLAVGGLDACSTINEPVTQLYWGWQTDTLVAFIDDAFKANELELTRINGSMPKEALNMTSSMFSFWFSCVEFAIK